MNANQVVIVTDRDDAEIIQQLLAGSIPNSAAGLVAADIAVALDRDFGALVEVVARAIASGAKSNCFERLDTGLEIRRVEQQCDRYRKMARAVLHALQEGTTDG